jgi:nucleoside diphosphate kinase
MTLEHSLFLIKPKGMEHSDKITNRLSTIGTIVTFFEYDTAPMNLVAEHYQRCRQQSEEMYGWMIKGYTGNPIASGIICGEEVIDKMIEITGDTCPEHAEIGTIRHWAFLLNGETMARSITERRMCDNFIHRSKRDAFALEKGIWHPEYPLYTSVSIGTSYSPQLTGK